MTDNQDTRPVGSGSEPTGQQQSREHLFRPGQSGNPQGRPKGARNRLGEEFLKDMLAAWEANGIAAIERVIGDRPQDFLKVVASILPKEIAAEVTHRYVLRAPAPVASMEAWLDQTKPKPKPNGKTTAIQ